MKPSEPLSLTSNHLEVPTGIELPFSVYKPYGGPAQALWFTYYAVVVISIFSIVLSYAIKSSKFGLALMSIREDEDAAEVLGVVTPTAKTWAFVFSALLPGMIGVLFFFKNGNVEPRDAFRLGFSIESLVMIMLGGQGTLLGPVIGALGYQRLRGTLLTSNTMIGTIALKDSQLVIAGLLMLLIILFIPPGIGWLVAPTLLKITEDTDMSILLQVQGVTKRFGGLLALMHVTFDLPARAKFWALSVRTVPGKLDRFNTINGVYKPEEGRIVFRGTGCDRKKTIPSLKARDGTHTSDCSSIERVNCS